MNSKGTEFSYVILGDSDVGKVSLLVQFTYSVFLDAKYEHTIDDSCRKMIAVDNENVVFTPNISVDNCVLRFSYIERAEAYIFVYSITNRKSFQMISRLRDDILHQKYVSKIPMILVGNKCDLEDQRQVSEKEGRKLANSFQCPFFEASAKDLDTVLEIYCQLYREVKTRRLLKAEEEEEGLDHKRPCSLQ